MYVSKTSPDLPTKAQESQGRYRIRHLEAACAISSTKSYIEVTVAVFLNVSDSSASFSKRAALSTG